MALADLASAMQQLVAACNNAVLCKLTDMSRASTQDTAATIHRRMGMSITRESVYQYVESSTDLLSSVAT